MYLNVAKTRRVEAILLQVLRKTSVLEHQSLSTELFNNTIYSPLESIEVHLQVTNFKNKTKASCKLNFLNLKGERHLFPDSVNHLKVSGRKGYLLSIHFTQSHLHVNGRNVYISYIWYIPTICICQVYVSRIYFICY